MRSKFHSAFGRTNNAHRQITCERFTGIILSSSEIKLWCNTPTQEFHSMRPIARGMLSQCMFIINFNSTCHSYSWLDFHFKLMHFIQLIYTRKVHFVRIFYSIGRISERNLKLQQFIDMKFKLGICLLSVAIHLTHNGIFVVRNVQCGNLIRFISYLSTYFKLSWLDKREGWKRGAEQKKC